jgi:hypothetical protein
LLPADPYRARRFLTCREVITTTVTPAASKASTSGPSLRSIAASPAPALARPRTSAANPAAVCFTVNRAITTPPAPTTQTAWSALAQSIPAITPPGGVSGKQTRAYSITASPLLAQWGGTPVHGPGRDLPVVSLIGLDRLEAEVHHLVRAPPASLRPGSNGPTVGRGLGLDPGPGSSPW